MHPQGCSLLSRTHLGKGTAYHASCQSDSNTLESMFTWLQVIQWSLFQLGMRTQQGMGYRLKGPSNFPRCRLCQAGMGALACV